MKTIKAYAIILSVSFLFLGCEKKMKTNVLEEELTQRMYEKALSYSLKMRYIFFINHACYSGQLH